VAELRGSKRGSRRRSERGPFGRSSFVLLALVSATMIVIGSSSPFQGVRNATSGLLQPFKAFGDTIAAPFSGVSGAVADRNRLRRENEDLRERLVEAQSHIAVADDALRERREVLALNGLESVTGLKAVSARVAASAFDNFESSIEIDRGTDDGVEVGMPVAAGLGLVGTVTVVTPGAARVRLFTDPESQVGVRHAQSGDVGVIRGEGIGKPMSVSLIDPATQIRPGDVMVTSGLPNSRYPAGLAVVSVISAIWEQGKLEQTVVVEPFTNLDRLTFVSVLLWTPSPPVPLAPPVTQPAIPDSTVDPLNVTTTNATATSLATAASISESP
jgi:rod shape-determining protein MreC